PEWARGAGAASCWQRCGRWPGASSCCLPCRAVGVAAARRADRDLVRDTGRLNHSRQPDLALAATPDPPGTREVHARSMRGASRKSSAGRHPSWLNLDSAQVSSRQVHGCTDPRAVARAPGCPDRRAYLPMVVSKRDVVLGSLSDITGITKGMRGCCVDVR